MPTITLNLVDTILQALKLKSNETKQSMSELVNDALKASLQKDLKSCEERKDEDTFSYEEIEELLKMMGLSKPKKLDIFSKTICNA